MDWSRDPWGWEKLAGSNTIEDTAVIFAVSRVFIIDFPPKHNGWAIMKNLSFLFFCVCTLSLAEGGQSFGVV